MNTPLISALCVTHKKPLMLKRVMDCFMNQSYPNKQLVVVYEDHDKDTCTLLESGTWDDTVKLVRVSASPVKLSLGELRNISIEAADGEYVCQWDDDDWYDPNRIAVQVEHIIATNRPACVLSQWVVFDAVNQKAYLSNIRLWEGSIMCKKEIIQQRLYAKIPKGEDTEVVDYLSNNDLLTVIHDMPELYIYIYHGTNTWEQAHFEKIFNASMQLSQDSCDQIIDILNSAE